MKSGEEPRQEPGAEAMEEHSFPISSVAQAEPVLLTQPSAKDPAVHSTQGFLHKLTIKKTPGRHSLGLI